MFGNGDMGDMMAKLQEMQAAAENTKKKLESINVQGKSPDGTIRFVMDGNKKLKEVTFVDDSILTADNKEEIEDMLVIAFNRALEEAEHVNELEMKNSASGMFPGV
jgi:nucleoid-associated protein EbfC